MIHKKDPTSASNFCHAKNASSPVLLMQKMEGYAYGCFIFQVDKFGGIVPQGGGDGIHGPAGAPPPQPLPATYSNNYNQQPMNNYNSYQQAPAPIVQQNQNLSQNPNLYGSPNMYAGSSLGGHDSSFQEEDYNYGIENTSYQDEKCPSRHPGRK